MAKRWMHPKSGIYYCRRRVPKDLLELVGRDVEKFSLKTSNRLEAESRFAVADQQFEARWANLRSGYRKLSWCEVAARGGDVYDLYLPKYQKYPSPHCTQFLIDDCL